MIEQDLYDKIVDLLPIICVDGFVFNSKKQILLLKRNNTPAKDEWWVPGGRVLKNEFLDDSIKRKIKDEIDVDIKTSQQVGLTETIFREKHTINICFKIMIGDDDVRINEEHSQFKWFDIDNLPQDLNQLIKNKIIEICYQSMI